MKLSLKLKQSRVGKLTCILLSLFSIVYLLPMNSSADTEIHYYSAEENCFFEVESNISSLWERHANIELKIKNTGDKKIENWHLTFSTPYKIENIWDASIVETDDNGTFTIRNNYYNQDIDVESEVTIGMTLDTGDEIYTDLSEWFFLNVRTKEVNSEEYNVTYQEYSKWDDGFNGAIMLSAIDSIEDWSLSFNSEYVITSVSNAKLEILDDSYVILNDGHSQNLSSNTLLLSVQGIPTESEFEFENLEMNSTGLAYHLTEDTDNDGIADYIEYVGFLEEDFIDEPATAQPTSSDSQINDMDNEFVAETVYIDEQINNYFLTAEYISDSFEVRGEKLLQIIMELSTEGYIDADSICFSVEEKYISFVPISGIETVVIYGNYEPFVNGLVGFRTGNQESIYSAPVSEPFDFNDIEGVQFYCFNSYEEYSDQDVKISIPFAYENTDYPANITRIKPTSISDFETKMDDGNVLILSTHGMYINGKFSFDSGLRFGESKNFYYALYTNVVEKYKNDIQMVYSEDASGNQSIKLWLYPSFIERNYEMDAFENHIVILDNCYAAGALSFSSEGFVDYSKSDSCVDTKFMNTFVNLGAEFVTGFQGEVATDRAISFSCALLEQIEKGKSFAEAFEIAEVECVDHANNAIPRCVYKQSAIIPTSTPTTIPTTTNTETTHERLPVDIWFIGEVSNRFDLSSISLYSLTLDYVRGKYNIGKDHFGVGYSAMTGTAYSYYSDDFILSYQGKIELMKAELENKDQPYSRVGDTVNPIDWFLYTVWSNDDLFSETVLSLADTRPEAYEETSFVFFIDASYDGYLYSEYYTEKAIECLKDNNVKVFFVNYGSDPISTDLLYLATATGGKELSSNPIIMWDELIEN